MKIELNIDSTVLGNEIQDLLKSLSVEQVQQIAIDVLKDYIKQPYDVDIAIAEKEIIQKIRKNASGYYENEYKTDEGVRKSREYKEWLSTYKDSRTVTIQKIQQSAMDAQRDAIKNLVNDNEGIQKLINEQIEIFKANIPYMIQQALTGMFMSHLSNMSQEINNQIYRNQQFNDNLANINNRLLSRGM